MPNTTTAVPVGLVERRVRQGVGSFRDTGETA